MHVMDYFRKISVWVHELIRYLPEQFKYLPEILKKLLSSSSEISDVNQCRNTKLPSKLQPIKNFQF